MMASVRRVVFASSMLLMALAVPGYSQETTGTILGALVDQTGGVLPGVKVVITSVDTGRTREVVTNDAGQYAANLPIGNYDISFVLPKFQPFTARGLPSRQRSAAGEWQIDGRCRGDPDGHRGTTRTAHLRRPQPDSAGRHSRAAASSPVPSSSSSRSCRGCRATSGRTPVSATRATSISRSTGHAAAPSTGWWMAPRMSTVGTTTRW